MEQDEIFLIDPEHQNRELVRKVAQTLMRSSFQTWDEIEVTGRRVHLLGQTIEEIHRIGHMRFSFDADELKEIRKLSYPNVLCWPVNYRPLFTRTHTFAASFSFSGRS